MKTGLDLTKIQRLLDKVCQEIGGDWLLTGGSLVSLRFDSSRGTEDIDLVNVRHPTLEPMPLQTKLFLEAKGLGLTPEAVNSAASFFVRQVPGWEKHLKEIQVGPQGKVFRPDLTLFVRLKLGRATPVDLADIAAAVRACGPAEFNETIFRRWATADQLKLFEGHRGRWGL